MGKEVCSASLQPRPPYGSLQGVAKNSPFSLSTPQTFQPSVHVSLRLRQLFLKCYPLCPLNLPSSAGAESLQSLGAICCHNNPSPTPEHSWTCLLRLMFLRGLCKVVSEKGERQAKPRVLCPWDSESQACSLPCLQTALWINSRPLLVSLVLECFLFPDSVWLWEHGMRILEEQTLAWRYRSLSHQGPVRQTVQAMKQSGYKPRFRS